MERAQFILIHCVRRHVRIYLICYSIAQLVVRMAVTRGSMTVKD